MQHLCRNSWSVYALSGVQRSDPTKIVRVTSENNLVFTSSNEDVSTFVVLPGVNGVDFAGNQVIQDTALNVTTRS